MNALLWYMFNFIGCKSLHKSDNEFLWCRRCWGKGLGNILSYQLNNWRFLCPTWKILYKRIKWLIIFWLTHILRAISHKDMRRDLIKKIIENTNESKIHFTKRSLGRDRIVPSVIKLFKQQPSAFICQIKQFFLPIEPYPDWLKYIATCKLAFPVISESHFVKPQAVVRVGTRKTSRKKNN